MISNDKKLDLAKAAVSLQASDPTAWATFISLLAGVSADADTQLVRSPTERLPVNQGRALAFRDLLAELQSARDTVGQRKETTNVRSPR